jgi:hypothetical protein
MHMKRIFSNFSLILLFPFRLIKKASKDNFVGGVVFGAVFSLVVNVITVQIQEQISKQRILEALENEIVNNLLIAEQVINTNKDIVEKNEDANPFHSLRKYSRDLWEQSTEPLQYVAQLDPTIQTKVILYYTNTLVNENNTLDRINDISNNSVRDCFGTFKLLNDEEKDICRKYYHNMLNLESNVASQIFTDSSEVLKYFKPTSERMKNPLLRFIMGSKATKILSER